ncbi:esterase-like activity of phytase family protein [Luteolibacter sp. LG18]|uniref:esterase-like activity of phytase family protein n=1 Tax=Luteolibacter sp. LG18 TaxID=2819286 RepID=UPI002B28D8E4|nr:hypothetical protein llg_34670 [Luteolibacter sp. LG18]
MHASPSSPGRKAAVLIGTAGLAAMPLAPLAHAAAFTAGNIAVLQADNASANNTTATIVELNPATANQTPANTLAIPSTGSSALRISGSATSTGYLANSNDGTLVCFTGHNSTTTSGNANTILARGVGSFDPSGTYALQATYTGGSGNQTRSAISLNNTAWFIGDQGGVYTNGSTSASPSGNFRSVKSFGGAAYIFQASASAAPVSTLSAPSGSTLVGLPGLPIGDSNKQDFYLVSSGDNGAAFDVLYVLSSTGIAKYSLVSGSWTANGSYTLSGGGFGLAAVDNGSGALLYVSTGTGGTAANSVLKLTDTAGYNATINITTANNVTLYTAPSGATVKGVAFAPVAITLSAPSFSTQPTGQTISTGATATLTASASGNPAPTYQWYQGNAGDTSNPVSGATSASLTTPALNATTSYWVRATNSQGSADSSAATITVSSLTNADLAGLTLSTGTLSPSFATGTLAYTAGVSNATTGITVTPTKSDVNATITVNGTAVTSGPASGNIPLNVGDNAITVVVTAPNGTTTKTYTVTVTRNGPTLATGAIAFTGFNADGTDDLAFVALADIPAGTQIYFNDNEWNGSAIGSGGAFNTGESEYRWTAPAGGVTAGTIVTLNSISGTITASTGSVVYTDSTNPGMSNGADTVYAFQGTSGTPTVFLASITNATGADAEIGGTGLTAGATAVVLPSSADGARYKGARSGQSSFAAYLSLIGNVAANWEDVGGGDGTSYLPFSTTAFTTGAGPASVTISDASVTEGNSGTATLAFTVSRSDNTGAFTVDYATANGTATAGSDYTAASGTLTFTAGGALTQTVNVTITGDTTVETDETLVVNLTNLVNTTGTASISDAQGNGTIVNDDAAPSVPYSSVSRDILTPNTGVWPSGGVTVGSTQFVNLGLQGVGRFAANSIDPATGESLGSISDMQVTNFVNNHNGTWSGRFNFLPDRGYNSGSIFSNYAARINAFDFTFTPYTATATTTAQNQIALSFAGSTRFTYDHDGNAGTAPVFTTGLNADSKTTLFGTTVPSVSGTSTQSDGSVSNRLTLDSEGLILDRRPDKTGSGWVGDEYGAYIYHFNAAKQIDGQVQLPAVLVPHTPVGTINFNGTPNNGRRDNQGMEGIAQSPDGSRLFGLMQSATIQDSGSGNQGRSNARLLVYDVSSSATPTTPVAQYVVQLPRIATTGGSVDRTGAQSSIVALNNHQLLILSRDGNGRGASGSPVFKSILLAELNGATNINGTYDNEAAAVAPGGVLTAGVTPVSWTEALNLIGKLDLGIAEVAKFGLNLNAAPGDINSICEKWEALGLVSVNDPAYPNDFFLFVGNDNDFLTSGGKYMDANGAIQSYNGGLENDTLVLAYRVRITQPNAPVTTWRETHFNVTSEDGLLANNADYDHDGVQNLVEYGLGIDPASATGANGLAALPTLLKGYNDPSFEDRLALQFTLPSPNPADVTYLVQGTEDLVTWTNIATKTGTGSWNWLGGGESRISAANGSGSITFIVGDSVPADGDHPKRMMRMKVTTP